MKIRITSAQRETYWYADKIGKEFDVMREPVDGIGYEVAHRERGGDVHVGYFVDKEDCEIVTDGLANIIVLPDESLGGVEREYREVKRKAAVGERIIVVDAKMSNGTYANGDVLTVRRTSDKGGAHIETNGRSMISFLFASEYAVLEPTDIIRVNGERFRMINRRAAVGERVISLVTECDVKTGGVYVVKSADNRVARVCDEVGDIYALLHSKEYHVLDPVETAPIITESAAEQSPAPTYETIEALTARVEALEETVRRMGTDLRVAREDIVLIEEGVTEDIRKLEREVAALKTQTPAQTARQFADKVTESIAESLAHPAKTAAEIAQARRDEIVERAKSDVKDLRAFAGVYLSGSGGMHFWPYTSEYTAYVPLHTVEYVVNRDKRKVTAIIKSMRHGRVYAVGRAKCAPNDVFNVHIGRAISLRRALGLEIPAEYLSVPKPTEIRVGDIIESADCGGIVYTQTVIKIEGNKLYGWRDDSGFRNPNCYTYRDCGDKNGGLCTNPKVIDDSREEAADSVSSTEGAAA
jgi:hypothetical protein